MRRHHGSWQTQSARQKTSDARQLHARTGSVALWMHIIFEVLLLEQASETHLNVTQSGEQGEGRVAGLCSARVVHCC